MTTLKVFTMEQIPPEQPLTPAQNPAPKKVLRRRAGFTLVEVWIGLLVTVMIAGLSLAAFRGRTKLATIRAVRDTISADIRAMQQYSLAGKTASICVDSDGNDQSVCRAGFTCNGTCENKVPSGGYGVRMVRCVSTTSACPYYLFADLNGDGSFSSNELLEGGTKTMERPVRTTVFYVYYASCGRQTETETTLTFSAFSGAAALAGSSSGCGAYGGSSERLREEAIIGTGSGGTATIIIRSGGGGIEEP